VHRTAGDALTDDRVTVHGRNVPPNASPVALRVPLHDADPAADHEAGRRRGFQEFT
jgi:hypothetical protein